MNPNLTTYAGSAIHKKDLKPLLFRIKQQGYKAEIRRWKRDPHDRDIYGYYGYSIYADRMYKYDSDISKLTTKLAEISQDRIDAHKALEQKLSELNAHETDTSEKLARIKALREQYIRSSK